MFMPKQKKIDDAKDCFYEELERAFNKIPDYLMKKISMAK
jgi:hypothetical protein